MWNWRTRGSESDMEEGSSEVRQLLRGLEVRRAEPSAFFAKRVMAAIEAREAELTRRVRAWAAVPTFASRLSAVAVMLLLLAGTWLYTGSSRRPNTSTGGLFEDSAAAASSTAQDEVFNAAAEDGR